jgi:hypothetical protein
MALTVYNTDAGVDLVGIPSTEAVGRPVIGAAASRMRPIANGNI